MGITAGRHTHVPEDVHCNIDLVFGNFCSIASGLTIVSGQHPGVDAPRAISDFPFNEHGWGEYPPSRLDGRVEVCNDVWIGQNVTILDGVTVQNGSRIGAGAVVTRSVRSYSVVVGNPAKETGRRFNDAQIATLLQIAWWEWADDEIEAALPSMADIAAFFLKYGGHRWRA